MLFVPRRSGLRLDDESHIKGERLVDNSGRDGRVGHGQVGVDDISRNLGGQERLFDHRAFGHELIISKRGSHLAIITGDQAGHVLAEFLFEFIVQTSQGVPRGVAFPIAANEQRQPSFIFPLGLGFEQNQPDREQTPTLFPWELPHYFLLVRNARGPFLW